MNDDQNAEVVLIEKKSKIGKDMSVVDVICVDRNTLELQRYQYFEEDDWAKENRNILDSNCLVEAYNNTIEMEIAYQQFEDLISEFVENCEIIDRSLGINSEGNSITFTLLAPLLFTETED